MAKSSTAVPDGPAVTVPSSCPLSQRKVTGPSGKPVAVALTAAPLSPLDGVTSSKGAASAAGAAASPTVTRAVSSAPLAAMRRGVRIRDLDLTRWDPRLLRFDRRRPAYRTAPAHQMTDSGGVRPPNGEPAHR